MKRIALTALPLFGLLAACSAGVKDLDQTGNDPQLPDQSRGLLPTMGIATPRGWNGTTPTAPAGYTVTAIAHDLKIPRQMLVLPNGDILVAEGTGGHEPKLRPKDIIAGFIKAKGKSTVKGGNRITLLRDSNGDGQTDLQTTFISGLDAPYGLALVGNELFVAEQGSLKKFAYTPGATSIAGPGTVVTSLPSAINHHWTKSLTASPDGTKLYVGIGSN
ncbi:MAG: sorbosone dehydrogenase family protein, partial [Novosphingobium sp.]